MRQGYRNLLTSLELLNPGTTPEIKWVELVMANGEHVQCDLLRVTQTEVTARSYSTYGEAGQRPWVIVPSDEIVGVVVMFGELPDGLAPELPAVLDHLRKKKAKPA